VLNAMHGRSTQLVQRRERMTSTAATDPRLPDAFVGMVAFGATFATAVVLARLGTAVGWGTDLAVMAVIGGFVCWWCRVLPSLFVAVCGWLMLNGIVVNGAGSLGWDGRHDLIRVGVLVGASLSVALVRAAELRLRSRAANQLASDADRRLYLVAPDRAGDRHA
jgi:hypothetical protein